MKINIEILGENLTGKTYMDFFTITWGNSSSYYNFTLQLKDQNWLDNPLLIINNPIIVIYLNADFLFNINSIINKPPEKNIFI